MDFRYTSKGETKMKKSITLLAAVILTLGSSLQAQNYTYVNSYTRADGGYVSGHYRTVADGHSGNNWSYSGNVNPFTGRVGSSYR